MIPARIAEKLVIPVLLKTTRLLWLDRMIFLFLIGAYGLAVGRRPWRGLYQTLGRTKVWGGPLLDRVAGL